MGGVEPGHRHRSRHGRGPPTGGGTPATGRDLDRGRGSPPRAGVHPDPRADPHPSRPTGRASGTDRHAPLPAGDTNVQLATFLSLTVPGGDEPSSGFHSQHAFVRRPRSWGAPPPAPPPAPRCPALTGPRRSGTARTEPPSFGTQLPKTPGAADFSEPDSRTRSPHGRVRTRDARFPGAPGARGGRGGGAAPWRARAKLQHKRPMAGSARLPGQAPPPLPALGAPPAALSARPRNAHPGAPRGPRGRGASRGRAARRRPALPSAPHTSCGSLSHDNLLQVLASPWCCLLRTATLGRHWRAERARRPSSGREPPLCGPRGRGGGGAEAGPVKVGMK